MTIQIRQTNNNKIHNINGESKTKYATFIVCLSVLKLRYVCICVLFPVVCIMRIHIRTYARVARARVVLVVGVVCARAWFRRVCLSLFACLRVMM